MKRLALLPAIALAACATTGDTPSSDLVAYEGGAACESRAIQRLARYHISEIDLETMPERYRIIRPGMAVTMDYIETRANLVLDEDDNVVRGYCG